MHTEAQALGAATSDLAPLHDSNLSPPPRRPSAPPTVIAALVFLLAVAPRLVGLETFVTTDELFWAGRTGNFAAALDSQRFGATFQTGHPGVITMWAGLIGMGPERAQKLASDRRGEISRSQVSRSPDFLPGLVGARRAMAVLTAAGVALMAILTWRLLGAGPALIGGVLVALDPFYAAHSQLLHLDALLATCMSIAVLAGLVRWQAEGAFRYVVLAAVATGLALLTKSPALFLLGFIPMIAVAASWQRHRRMPPSCWMDLLVWAGLTVVTYALCWPAIWGAPLETLRGVAQFMLDNANPGHAAVAEGGAGSGPLFYLAAFLLRTTPMVTVGLVVLALELAASRRGWRGAQRLTSAVAALAMYAGLFGVAMTVSAKTFDRYLLPALPAIDLLAGAGLALTVRRLRWLRGVGVLLAAVFALPVLAYPLASTMPYALTWYNPLAGGGPAAQRLLSVGWGEGLDQVARYLNTRPGAESLKVSMPGEIYTTVLNAQFSGQVMPAEGGDPSANGAAYFVTYVRARSEDLPVYDRAFQTWPPELVVRLAGVDYASIYPAESGIPVGADFAGLAKIAGYGIDSLSTRPGRSFAIKLFWLTQFEPSAQSRAILLLTDMSGREVARAEHALGPLPASQVRARTYQLPVPAGLAAGQYLVWVGVEARPGEPLALVGRPDSLAQGAPEHPERAVLRSVQVR